LPRWGTGERIVQPASKFVDGSPHLVVRVQEVDGINSFLAKLLLLF